MGPIETDMGRRFRRTRAISGPAPGGRIPLGMVTAGRVVMMMIVMMMTMMIIMRRMMVMRTLRRVVTVRSNTPMIFNHEAEQQ